MSEVVFKDESYAIMGACFEVYKVMGCGFLEAVYQECLELEFAARGIPFVPWAKLTLTYKGLELKQTYVPDFVCYSSIIVELKACRHSRTRTAHKFTTTSAPPSTASGCS